MPIIIKMPKLSDTMTEGKLLKWNKKVGDTVAMGDLIAEVETDKATMEMEAFDDGVVHHVFLEEGAKVIVGGAMMLLLEEGEDPSSIDLNNLEGGASLAAEGAEDSSGNADKQAALSGGAKGAENKGAEGGVSPVAEKVVAQGALPPAPQRHLKASPLAKKVAAKNKICLERVDGSGPGGRIVRADIERVLKQGSDFVLEEQQGMNAAPVASVAPGANTAAILPSYGSEDEVLELSSMRKIIADRLLTSKQQLPHFYLRKEIDAAPLMKLRKEVNEAEAKRENGNKYSVNDFVLRAVVGAAEEVPDANASWNGDSIVRFAKVGLSVAIAVEDGLVTPVVADAGSKSLLEISQAVKDLAARAKAKKLKPSEFDGGTITVSNLGAWGVDHFDAIINPPQAVIVSVGGIAKKPVVNSAGEIVVGQRMWLGISADHRVVDGAVAAELLAAIAKLLEQPALMLV